MLQVQLFNFCPPPPSFFIHAHLRAPESRDNDLTFGRPNWLANSGEEHLACREGVALFDLTSFAKFEIEVHIGYLSSQPSLLELNVSDSRLLSSPSSSPTLTHTHTVYYPWPKGIDAESALQRLCSNNVAVPPGKIVYTGMLNGHGGFQTDCTVTRLTQDKLVHYMAVTWNCSQFIRI